MRKEDALGTDSGYLEFRVVVESLELFGVADVPEDRQ